MGIFLLVLRMYVPNYYACLPWEGYVKALKIHFCNSQLLRLVLVLVWCLVRGVFDEGGTTNQASIRSHSRAQLRCSLQYRFPFSYSKTVIPILRWSVPLLKFFTSVSLFWLHPRTLIGESYWVSPDKGDGNQHRPLGLWYGEDGM